MTEERDADEWWAKLPARRRTQIHRYLAKPDGPTPAVPGQLNLLEEGGIHYED